MLRLPVLVSVLAVIGVSFVWGGSGVLTVVMLAILGISLSVDNAVINSKVLGRMSPGWQKAFLSIGLIIAVVGMRLLFPLIVVAFATHLSPSGALTLALAHPSAYAAAVLHAHLSIAVFGGTFLFLLFLNWLIEERDVRWLDPLETWLSKMGRVTNASVFITGIVLLILSAATHNPNVVLTTGLISMLLYTAVNSLDVFFNANKAMNMAAAGLATFLYLEVLDASFSFDDTISSFAISDNIFLIAIGLGIGAMYVRGLTVYLVRKGTLSEYKYLEHGAMFAIGSLSILLLVSTLIDVPQLITGFIGVVFIGASVASSRKAAPNRPLLSKQVALK